MKNKVKNKLKLAIIQHMFEMSFKSFLECTNDDIYDMYESEEFDYSDFYDILKEMKKDTLEHYKSDDIPEICETVECYCGVVEIKETKVEVNKHNNDYSIRNLYFKFKETEIPIKRFYFLYNDSSYTLQRGNIDIIFSEGDDFNIKKLEYIKNKYAERFVYFLEHDILITDN